MSILPKIYTLKDEAQAQLYEWFDKEIRALPKRADGTIDPFGDGLDDNDVDAMRHAFVSGVYTLEFSEDTAELMGRLNELQNFDYSSSSAGSENMDLWNNAIGRKFGKKSKSREELLKFLKQALNKGELIITPDDPRKYIGDKFLKKKPKNIVIQIQENKTGANILFYDLNQKIVMSKEEFLNQIKAEKYPDHSFKIVDGIEIPMSKRDRFKFNNLG
jgi:hypothetical protein